MKVLVIASEPISADRLRAALGGASDDAEIMVVAPALHRSVVRFWLSVADEAIRRAELVQRETVEGLDTQDYYIEYPSHYNNGLDSPVGLAFRAQTSIVDMPDERDLRSECAWFTVLPDKMHDEQKEFLVRHLDIVSRGSASET